MKEIKFRVWDNRLNKFNWFDLTSVAGNLPIDCIDNVNQFTNLKDKNSVDIYEGDIIRYNRRGGIMADHKTYIDTIVSGNRMGQFILYFSNDKGQYEAINSWNFLYDTFEVIGNIYENPELLG